MNIITDYAPAWFAEKFQMSTPQVTQQVTWEVMRLLPLCVTPISRKELQEEILTDEQYKVFSKKLINTFVEKEILDQIGTTGKGTYYILRRQRGHKGDIKET